MTEETFRYFIELKADAGTWESRQEENEARRAQALQMIGQLRDWLRTHGLEEKVSTMAPTIFGQVQITCASDVMQRIRDEEPLDIAAIRHGYLSSNLKELRSA